MNLKKHAERIIYEAIDAVKPDILLRKKLRFDGRFLMIDDRQFDLDVFDRILIVGAGKASAVMAHALKFLLKERIHAGVVSVKYGHKIFCRNIEVLECGHPVPDQSGLDATNQILKLALEAGERDLIFCLISGGGSALLEKLPEDISLKDLQKVSQLLLSCGADIREFNTVRKHLSIIKGGRLAGAVYPAACITLILSDVIGDPVDTIASGPTAPDLTTFTDAWNVIQKYRLKDQIPGTVRCFLEKGLKGDVPETLKPEDPVFKKVANFIIGNNLVALKSAQKEAEKLGYHTLILSDTLQGEAREAGSFVAEKVQQILKNNKSVEKPVCLLWSGETTVTLIGSGKGGRNQELAVAALLALESCHQSYLIASIGTDGTDGPTDAAGGMVSPETWKIAEQKGLRPEMFLFQNNTYAFLEQTGGLVKTGPTGTNVMDMVVALVPGE